MVESTFEEAKRCPKCNQPGDDRSQIKSTGVRGATVHQIYCMTKLCPWYDTPWLVQVNADGTIPQPTDHTNSSKVYVGFEQHDQIARDIEAALRAQAELETQRDGHGEIRNPYR